VDRQVAEAANAGTGVPLAVLEATRSLLRLETAADARRISETLVIALGGVLVPAEEEDDGVIPADVSFGDGEPQLPKAQPGTVGRELLDRYLNTFLLDARQALELSGRTERLAETASTDVLTSLPNRRMIERALGRLVDGDTVIMMDLDHFKQINDVLGHAAGDEVLRAFGKVLRETVRGRDIVGRYGGEEFVLILSHAVGATTLLERLRTQWLEVRPFPVTFSAGIARSGGDADETMRLADEALYAAKAVGRDQWVWAGTGQPVVGHVPRDFVSPYLEDAIVGKRRPAVRMALDLLDNHVPRDQILDDLLAAAQREVGERWHRNELSTADEHLATGVAAAALDALAGESQPEARGGLTVVACAEGDWHSLAAQMVGEVLRVHGVNVIVLGASTPAEAVADYLVRSGCDSLAVSCSISMYLPGALGLVNAAHLRGVPVIVGGRAFGADRHRADRIGADAWAPTGAKAATILAAWRASPPIVAREPTVVDGSVRELLEQADAMGDAASVGLAARFPIFRDSGPTPVGTREDLGFVVQFLAAAQLVDDRSIFTEFLTWLRALLVARGAPPLGLVNGLGELLPLVRAIDHEAAALLDAGRQALVAGRL
jgi:diguanylate cyclase (GGDEF)-like protein